MYVYIQTARNPDLYTVGFYTVTGSWIPESDYSSRNEAIRRVRFLNGHPNGLCKPQSYNAEDINGR